MDMHELARMIAGEVLKKLREEENAVSDSRECALVLAPHDCLLAGKVSEKLGDEYEIFFAGDDLHGRKPCRYVLPALGCADMAALAAGGSTGDCTAAVLKLLLQGETVEVLEYEYHAYGNTAPGPLYTVYEAHAETLSRFGLKPFQPKQPETVRFRESLVTGAAVDEAKGASVLMVPENAVVTPQAYEVAGSLNITIEKCL